MYVASVCISVCFLSPNLLLCCLYASVWAFKCKILSSFRLISLYFFFFLFRSHWFICKNLSFTTYGACTLSFRSLLFFCLNSFRFVVYSTHGLVQWLFRWAFWLFGMHANFFVVYSRGFFFSFSLQSSKPTRVKLATFFFLSSGEFRKHRQYLQIVYLLYAAAVVYILDTQIAEPVEEKERKIFCTNKYLQRKLFIQFFLSYYFSFFFGARFSHLNTVISVLYFCLSLPLCEHL